MDDTTKSRCRGNVPESAERAAGAPGVEITPAMVEAGVETYYGFSSDGWGNPGNDEVRAMVREVFMAMSHRRSART